jgi:glycosyltransferase involved in cell wall biosynthesis
MDPLISVVLTTYNRCGVLGDTIESILNQSEANFELLICDDASNDDTARLCQGYSASDERIRYLRGDSNVGMPLNLNRGILAARGAYIANVHDGDIYPADLLLEWLSALEACEDALFVFNGYAEMDCSGSITKEWLEDLPSCFQGEDLLKLYFRQWRFGSPVWGTVMARRSAYDQVGLFDPRFGFWSDVDMWMRMAEQGRVAYVRQPLIKLPSRSALPSWIPRERERVVVRQIFLEARVRHAWRNRPLGLVELPKHLLYVCADWLYTWLLRVRRRALNAAKRS